MSSSRAKVLVTGATGFTGRYLLPLLERAGYEVHGISRKSCDLRRSSEVHETVRAVAPSKVIHLAGTPSLPDSAKEELHALNAQGTANLLEACAALPTMPDRVVLASSCYVYGDTGDLPATEDAPLRPSTEYGRSKLEMERIAAAYSARMSVLVVRPFNYTGVGHGERFLVPRLIRAFRQREGDVSFVDPAVERDFSDVRWLAATYVRLLAGTSGTGVCNVCSGAATRLIELVGILERITGYSPRTKPVFAGPPMHRLVGSAARLAALTGRHDAPSLEETLTWMYQAA